MILRCCGLWIPREWSSGWKKIIYSCYTFFSIFLTYTFTLSELIAFIMTIDDVDEVVNNSLMLLSMLGICYKIFNFIWKHDEILELTEILRNDICRPRGCEEMKIQKRFDCRGRSEKSKINQFKKNVLCIWNESNCT